MAETGTQQTDTVLPEYQEKYLKDLLATAQSVAGAGQEIPKYEDFVAALTPAQLKAIEIGTRPIVIKSLNPSGTLDDWWKR